LWVRLALPFVFLGRTPVLPHVNLQFCTLEKSYNCEGEIALEKDESSWRNRPYAIIVKGQSALGAVAVWKMDTS